MRRLRTLERGRSVELRLERVFRFGGEGGNVQARRACPGNLRNTALIGGERGTTLAAGVERGMDGGNCIAVHPDGFARTRNVRGANGRKHGEPVQVRMRLRIGERRAFAVPQCRG